MNLLSLLFGVSCLVCGEVTWRPKNNGWRVVKFRAADLWFCNECDEQRRRKDGET